ncbi:acyl-CoA/acyl-ACP dehydrogenase [Polynucleobacter sp. MWH-HuK1]|nr:acyl-CoA/acyl-ACP dehydrogenase [Polynucleobacter sp. MWH-HuK1]
MTLTEEFDQSLLPGELILLESAKLFGATNISPNAKQWEYTRKFPIDELRQAIQRGFGSIELPQIFGGPGFSFGTKMRIAEELSKFDLAFTFALIQHHNALVRVAELSPSDHSRELIASMLTGDLIGCTAMSEPEAGSDFSSLKTVAKKVAGGWILNGKKGWITNATDANVCLTYAQTDTSLGSKGIACFVVLGDKEGFIRQAGYELHGAHAAGVGGYGLVDYFVPDALVLYAPGLAFKTALQGVNRARIHVTAMNAGMLESSLSIATQYGENRRAFGKSILEFQGLAWSLANVATSLEAMRSLAYRGARQIMRGEDALDSAAIAKKFGNEQTLSGVAACMQAMGANGLRAEYPLARHLAAAKLLSYTDGTVEMMNERISGAVKKRYVL